jgi:hypothetical protein
MLPPINTVYTEHWHLYHSILSGIAGIGGWEGIRGIARTIVRAMPPIPENANWWEKWGYAALQSLARQEAKP